MDNEGLDQISAGFANFLRSTEISGIPFDKSGIELMLADQEAESIAEAGLTVARAVSIRFRQNSSLPRRRLRR